MNLEKLKQLVGGRVKLRPKVKSRDEDGVVIENDDEWLPQEVDHKTGVRLQNCRTGHIARLNSDHIHHFTSAPQQPDQILRGFLEIQVHLVLSGDQVEMEPMLSGAGRVQILDSREEDRVRFAAEIAQNRMRFQQEPNTLRESWLHGLDSLLVAGASYAARFGGGKRAELERLLAEYRAIEKGQLFQLSTFDVLDDRTISEAGLRRDRSQRLLLDYLGRMADFAEISN